MKRQNGKPALLIILTLISIVFANVIFNTDFFSPQIADAEIRNGMERTVNASTGYSVGSPDIANDPEGNFVSVWRNSGMDGNGDGIFLQRFDRFGTRLESNDVQINSTSDGAQGNPGIAMDKSGNYVVVWQGDGAETSSKGIYARAYDKNGIAVTDETLISAVNNDESSPKIAIDYDNDSANGSFVITWESAIGDKHEIFARRCSVNFETTSISITRIGNEINVTDDPALLTGHNPNVAVTTNGDFMIAWRGRDSIRPDSDQALFQAYDNSGNKVGTYTKVNSDTVNELVNSDMGISVDKKTRTSFGGSFIIAYAGITPEFPNGGIFARQIKCWAAICQLNPVELKVFTGNRGAQEENPSVDSDYFGNFTVTWQGYDPSNDYEIFAQSYSWNNGRPLGQITRVSGETKVNTTTVGPQETPAISMNGDGQYIIAFTNGTTNSDIKYQSFVSNLFKEGSETLVHPPSAVNQYGADTSASPNGYHATTWVNSSGPRGIFFTLWDEDDNIIAQNIRVDSDDPSNVDDNPSISFYKDTEGSNQGRFIIAWEGVAPACLGTTGGLDILYREINASGEVQGPCESRANDNIPLDQTQPDVSAGYYNNDGSETENTFVISYFENPEAAKKVKSVFHAGLSYIYNEIATDCDNSYCLKNSVVIDPSNSHIVYSWDNADDFRDGVFIRQGVAGALVGSANLQVNSAGLNSEDYPDVAFLPNDQFIVTYGKTVATAQIYAKRYLFNDAGNPSVVDEEFRCCTAADFEQDKQYYPRIASDPADGDFIITWSYEVGENRIFGRFFEYVNSGTGGITAFGPPFMVNSTQDGTSTLPAIDMDGNGKVTVAWEGTVIQPTSDDSNGITIQRLKNALYTPPFPELQPSAEQVITGGGRTMSIPSSIQFPPATISTSKESAVQTSVRDASFGGSPDKYIEVTDLDGAPFTITATISDDFHLTPPGTASYIPKTAAFIRNWDQNDADTNADCPLAIKTDCVLTINSSSQDTSFELSPESEDFTSLDEQRTLVNKQSDSEIGKWRFYPEFMLKIPVRTPPGNHTAEIIFTLT